MSKRGIICFCSGCSCRCSGGGSSGQAAPLVCWIVIIAASTISDLLILW
ncbi:hypothetical protein [Agathobaculum butyriciproducens]